jgi:hypothetical protein
MDKETPIVPANIDVAETPSPPRESLSVKQLAQAVLDRTLRPRAADIRRLAEAVLERAKPGKKKNKKLKASKDEATSAPKKRKQAKIPAKQAKPS